MAYVKQKNKFDCGVAAVAMLCEVTYEEANRVIPWRRQGHLEGTDSSQLTKAMNTLGWWVKGTKNGRLRVITAPREYTGKEVGFEIWSFIPDNSLVKVRLDDSKLNFFHWVVWRKGKIYDPSLGVFKPKKYCDTFPAVIPSSYLKVEKKNDK